MESLKIAEEQHEKQIEGEEVAKEEIFVFEYDRNECDVAFVFEGKTNKTLHCPSSFLNRISKEFQNNMVKTDDGSHYEIKAEGFDVEAITKALSFYQPKHFKLFTDSDDFRAMLTICSKFLLNELQKSINSYLLEQHKSIVGQRFLREHHYPILQMAKDFCLDTVYDKIMGFEIDSLYTINRTYCSGFLEMSDSLKYEIVKKYFKNLVGRINDNRYTSHQMSSIKLEVMTIFHFLDLYLYENKILDYALHSKNVVASNIMKNDSCSLFEKDEINNVYVKVEGKELFVNSTILSDNSPVFKAMLNSTFKEGLEKVIKLPGKNAEDIIELFKSLIHTRDMKEYDAFVLLPLCREYQIEWLQDLIQEQMIELKLPSDQLLLKYLKLSHDIGFLKGEEHFVNSLSESLIQIQRYTEFNNLKDETKLLVVLRRVHYICRFVKESLSIKTGTCFFDKQYGFPSIFKDVINVPFQENTTEIDTISFFTAKVDSKCNACKGSGQVKQTSLFGRPASEEVDAQDIRSPFSNLGNDW